MLNAPIKILLISNSLWDFGEGMFGPLFALFSDRIGGSILDISWAWAGYLVVKGVTLIISGKISDKWVAKENLVVAGYALNTLMTFGYLLVHSSTDLMIIEAGLGMAAALTLPSWHSLYARYSKKRNSGFLWGLASGQSDLLAALGMLIGGLIVAKLSFNALFITMGLIQLSATLYQAKILYYGKGSKNSKKVLRELRAAW